MMFSKALFTSLMISVLSVNALSIPFARSPVEGLDSTWSKREPEPGLDEAYTFYGREPEPEDEGNAFFEREPEPEYEDYTFFGREPKGRLSSLASTAGPVIDLLSSTVNLANSAT